MRDFFFCRGRVSKVSVLSLLGLNLNSFFGFGGFYSRRFFYYFKFIRKSFVFFSIFINFWNWILWDKFEFRRNF